MLREGVAAKIWAQIWDFDICVGGGPAPQERFWYIDLLEFSQNAHSMIEVSEFLFVILF